MTLQADTAGNGIISALEAAAFMKKSGLQELVLSQVILSELLPHFQAKGQLGLFFFSNQIWEMADPSGKGYLDKQAFCAAMKLIAVAQTGQEASLALLTTDHPPPNMVSLLSLFLV